MFAIFKTGGKQYRAATGDVLKVEKLTGEIGSKILLEEVLSANGKITDLAKAKIEAEIVEQAKDKKVIVFKKKRRHNYRRKIGHRQFFTTLRILSITDAEGKIVKAETKAKPTPAKVKNSEAGEKKPAAAKKTENAPVATQEEK